MIRIFSNTGSGIAVNSGIISPIGEVGFWEIGVGKSSLVHAVKSNEIPKIK